MNDFFRDADRQRVNRQIQAAESRTSAEIVPVVARSSGRYDRPEDMVGLWSALLAMTVVWFCYPLLAPAASAWGAAAPLWQLVWLAVAIVGGFVLGAVTADRVDWLRRLFTPHAEMRDEVFARARAAFFDNRVHHTAGGAGVLLYVSLFERMAAVIADQAVIEACGQQQIDAFCREFTKRLHEGSPTDALCATIQSVGDHLAGLLPRAAGDINELADALVVIE